MKQQEKADLSDGERKSVYCTDRGKAVRDRKQDFSVMAGRRIRAVFEADGKGQPRSSERDREDVEKLIFRIQGNSSAICQIVKPSAYMQA